MEVKTSNDGKFLEYYDGLNLVALKSIKTKRMSYPNKTKFLKKRTGHGNCHHNLSFDTKEWNERHHKHERTKSQEVKEVTV